MASTTIKVSVATRDRIRSYGGATHEATIIAALDALDERDGEEFWAQAERARRAYDALPQGDRDRIRAAHEALDAVLDQLR